MKPLTIMMGYPVTPWIGIMLVGYVFGQYTCLRLIPGKEENTDRVGTGRYCAVHPYPFY